MKYFFFIGTSLLSIGYKYKLKIDFFFLILILLIYSCKIIFYHSKLFFDKKEIFATLYYYLYDYGIIMMNPIFNLPYFLIGMYFGFINYTIYKGIIDINMNNQIFKQIHLDNSLNHEVDMIEKTFILSNRTSFGNSKNRDVCQLNLFEKDEDEGNNILCYNKSVNLKKKNIAQKLFNQNNRNSINSDNESSKGDLKESKNQRENSEDLSMDIIQKKKLKDIPFLNSSISIIEWHRNPNL